MPERKAVLEAAGRCGVHAEIEVIDSNERLLARMEAEPGLFDVVFPSDYMVERLRNGGRLREIESDTVPLSCLALWTVVADHDPGARHSIPFAFGTTGYLHNDQLADASTWMHLFDPPDHVKVGMLDEMREVIGAALLACGHSPNSTNESELDEASALIRGQRDRVADHGSNADLTPVAKGTVAAQHAWSGPAALVARTQPQLEYVVPDEGAMLWITTAAIPADAPDPDLSLAILRELMDPALAAMTTARNGFATPNEAARALLTPAVRDDPILFPSEATLKRCHTARDLGPDETKFRRRWRNVR